MRFAATAHALAALAWLQGTVLSPASGWQQPSCSCLGDFEGLVSKLEADYIAFHLEVHGDRRAQYDAVTARARERARTADDAECLFVLRDWLAWFGDGHLFINEAPQHSPEEIATLRRQTETAAVTRRTVTDHLRDAERTLDPIEGIWYSTDEEFAIIRRPDGRREFIAVILATSDTLWEPGQVRATFRPAADGTYRADLRARDHSLRHLNAQIYKNLLLQMPPMVWGRRLPLALHEEGLLHPDDPEAPTFKALTPDAAVISLPSHGPQYHALLDSVLAEHHEDLTAANVLIIDLRGDGGGDAGTSDPLVPYYYGDRRRPKIGPPGPRVVIASDDNLTYLHALERFFDTTPEWLTSLMTRMEARPGQILPFLERELEVTEQRPDTVYTGPAHVAILIDRGVASAGEAFLLSAMTRERVTLFGEHTSGTIDYQNVALTPFGCRAHGLRFGYPTVAASPDLPEGGLNKEGIPPDVAIDPSRPDKLQFVLDWYRRRSGS